MKNRIIINQFLLLAILLSSSTLNSFAKKDKKGKADNSSTSTGITKKDVEEQAIFIAGMQAYILGNSQEAVTKFNEVIRRNPKNHAEFYELAKIAFE